MRVTIKLHYYYTHTHIDRVGTACGRTWRERVNYYHSPFVGHICGADEGTQCHPYFQYINTYSKTPKNVQSYIPNCVIVILKYLIIIIIRHNVTRYKTVNSCYHNQYADMLTLLLLILCIICILLLLCTEVVRRPWELQSAIILYLELNNCTKGGKYKPIPAT